MGVFDSGVGGISVLKHIRTRLPGEDLIYCADSKNAPYGSKTPDFICRRSMAIAEFLINSGAKALVVACNTATAAAIAPIRECYDLPVIGMEPAVKPAVAATKTGVVGVLATVGTLKSARFAGLLEHYGSNVKIVTQGCPGLVEQIEKSELESAETRKLLEIYLKPLLDAGADTVVLGCTHYPFLRPLIQEIAGEQVKLIDTGSAVGRQLEKRLKESNLLTTRSGTGNLKFYTNSSEIDAHRVMQSLWGESVSGVELLPV